MTRASGTWIAAGRRASAWTVLAAVGALSLAACEQRAEPRPAYEAAPPPPPAPLAGAPETAPTALPPAPDAGAPPPGDAAPSLAPPEGPPPPPPPAHDEGLVAMAPIPNPEDGGPIPPRARPVPREPRHVYSRHAPYAAPAPVRSRVSSAHHLATAPRPHAASPAPAQAPAAHAPAVRPAPKPHAAPPPIAKPTLHHERRATDKEMKDAKAASANTTGNATGADADARVETLRSALSGALARGAVLTAPKAVADQASEVTLTVPADFYDTLKTEAGKQAMGDAAASANLNATLTGEGYAIIPAGAQAQPLRVGQPTVFRWTLTPEAAGAKGPVRADVTLDLLGGGSQSLALGAIDTAKAGGGAPKWWGAALLALVVVIGFGWLLRSGTSNGRIAASRARARRPNGTVNGDRPLDMPPRDPDGR